MAVNVDLVAYLALNEFSNTVSDAAISEDVASKMLVHSKRINKGNSGVVIKL